MDDLLRGRVEESDFAAIGSTRSSKPSPSTSTTERKDIEMSATPAPFPEFIVAGRRNRSFRHQVLGYPIPNEWLEKRSMELIGKVDIYRAVTQALIDFGSNRPLRGVYDRKNNEYMYVISMGENLAPATVRDPPEEECEWFRNYFGVEGKPLWYDVCG
ncbi:hypothetical protein SCHPADRAFT_901843 [Schizopora paradoxa]|uniref:Uncharacterized protein n=1 Tax=Schizopora paradoxa TaxID=27342 RepID=A0A0H2RW24_9AGAM|nr:hypothetical protein SCHPADRAFT_901843 [Schizopora paradoxa]